ncbi:unnamed protein product, partial [Rotaria sp. Silwood2]
TLIHDNVKKACENIAFNKTVRKPNTLLGSSDVKAMNVPVFLPLPVLGHAIIDDLPVLKLTIPLNSDEFDWELMLRHLADDLEVNKDEILILEATKGSTTLKIVPKEKILRDKEKLEKIKKKFSLIIKDAGTKNSTSKIDEYLKMASIEVHKDFYLIPSIIAELQNFDKVLNGEVIIPDNIDLFFELNERPTIIDDQTWELLKKKSQQLSIVIYDSLRKCNEEYIISNMSLVYNEELVNGFIK